MAGETTQRPILDPPATFLGSLRFLGPGLILSAAIVGSGELIATTVLGAKAGFTVLWVIVVSCLIKVTVQLEYGRHCICHGVTSFHAWDQSSGPRLLNRHWTVYTGVFFLVAMLVGQGGVLGGAAQVLAHSFPGTSDHWVYVVAALVALVVFRGKYESVQGIATLLNVLFVSSIVFCVLAVQWTPYHFGLADVARGLSFTLPTGVLALAITAFGITGLSAGELFVYPSWCIEKGYAAWTGPMDDSPEWAARARGWTRVMTYDALASMVIYTVATVAFYFLGAAVLQPQEAVADGNGLILQLSLIFTDVLGPGARSVFMVGAFAVLFSTAFANCAGHSRLWVDLLGLFAVGDPHSASGRRRTLAIIALVMPLLWGTAYFLTSEKPLSLVIVLGVANALFLLVVAYHAVRYRYRCTPAVLAPSRTYDVLLWLSLIAIASMAGYVVWKTVENGLE